MAGNCRLADYLESLESLETRITGGISRRRLDVAINHVKDGLAYPSEGFLNLRAMAQRLAGRELTAAELRGLVEAYKLGQQDEQIG